MGNSDLLAKPAPPELARDLEEDLAICEAATPGPYQIRRCECGHPACDQYFISVTNSDGRLDPQDAKFYSEAITGWPYAIRLALKYEKEIDRLQNELQIYQEQERGIRGPWD